MPTATAEGVREVIREHVLDPEIGFNIVDLGLVYDIVVDDAKNVDIKLTLTSPACPLGPQLIRGTQTCIQQAYPDLESINIRVVWTPPWTPDLMSQEAKDTLGFF